MLNRRASLRLFLIGGAAAGLAACGGGAKTTVAASGEAVSGGTILDVLRANGLTRFLKALQTTGLDKTLESDGPYTIFAPTNAAFAAAKLPSDPEQLRQIIANHIVPGMFTSDFLRGVNVKYTTLAGTSIAVDGTGSTIIVGGATVVTLDMGADNGVVSSIDRVLTPGPVER